MERKAEFKNTAEGNGSFETLPILAFIIMLSGLDLLYQLSGKTRYLLSNDASKFKLNLIRFKATELSIGCRST